MYYYETLEYTTFFVNPFFIIFVVALIVSCSMASMKAKQYEQQLYDNGLIDRRVYSRQASPRTRSILSALVAGIIVLFPVLLLLSDLNTAVHPLVLLAVALGVSIVIAEMVYRYCMRRWSY